MPDAFPPQGDKKGGEPILQAARAMIEQGRRVGEIPSFCAPDLRFKEGVHMSLEAADLFSPEWSRETFPPERADDFFDALFFDSGF